MRIACWIPKATDTHSEYVILSAFPLQQRLHERASMLRFTFVACCIISRHGLMFILKFLYHFNQATRRHIPKYCSFKNQCLLCGKFYSAVVTHLAILLDQLCAFHTALRMSGNKISFRCVQSVVIWTYCHWGPPCHYALKCHIFVINVQAT